MPSQETGTGAGIGPAPVSAGVHAVSAVPTASPDARAGAVRSALADRKFDYAGDITVCVDENVVGLVAIEELLAAAEETPLTELVASNKSWTFWRTCDSGG